VRYHSSMLQQLRYIQKDSMSLNKAALARSGLRKIFSFNRTACTRVGARLTDTAADIHLNFDIVHTWSRKRVLDVGHVGHGCTLSHSIDECLGRVRVGVKMQLYFRRTQKSEVVPQRLRCTQVTRQITRPVIRITRSTLAGGSSCVINACMCSNCSRRKRKGSYMWTSRRAVNSLLIIV
jgi:hypothetical protein